MVVIKPIANFYGEPPTSSGDKSGKKIFSPVDGIFFLFRVIYD
jgi:hypothetical protein